MPRFYFHIFDDIVSMDETGQVADDLPAARSIALDGARDLVCEQIRRGYLNLENYIVVADEQGEELCRFEFREAFTVRSKRTETANAAAGRCQAAEAPPFRAQDADGIAEQLRSETLHSSLLVTTPVS